MSLRCHFQVLALTVLTTGLLSVRTSSQTPVPTPVDPAPAKQERPKQDRPAPAPAPQEKAPAKKKIQDAPKAVEAKQGSKVSKKASVSKKAASQPASKPADGKTAKASKETTTKDAGKKVSKKNGKKVKEPEAEEMKKVTINISTKDVNEEEEVPLPEGANESDIRAIRGANAMLKAEKQLKQILKNLKVKGDAVPVPFRKIDSWTYEDGFKGMPKDILKLDGKRVVMAGFMLPIYEVENIKTFYLVKSLWSCCYGIPPDVNGLIRVEVKKKGGVNYQYDPIFIVGTFKVKEIKDEDYTVCLYEIVADDIRVLDLKIK